MSLLVNWALKIDPSVLKSLTKIPKKEAQKIASVFNSLPSDPYFGDIQKISNDIDTWRRRIGNYRLFYKLFTDEKVILVFDLKRRTSKTY